jgi:predicted nucleic acid-binding Zn ribbon protein
LVSFGHCVVCSSLIYRFWLPLWYLLTITSSAFLRYTDSDYSFGILWPLCRQFIFDIQILITPLISCGHCVVCYSSIYRFDYPFGILWPLFRLLFFDIEMMITPLVSFGHCVVCSSSIYRFWLPFGILWPLCRLLIFDLQILITLLVSCGHCVVCSSSIYRFWLPLWYLHTFRISITIKCKPEQLCCDLLSVGSTLALHDTLTLSGTNTLIKQI